MSAEIARQPGGEGSLIKNSRFETLLQNIETVKKEESKKTEHHLQLIEEKEKVFGRCRKIFLSIMFVYFYLRFEHEMPRVDLSIEDFDATREHLSDLARRKHKGIKARIVHALFGTIWGYYIEFGHFPVTHIRWFNFHPICDYETQSFDPFMDLNYKTKYDVTDKSFCVPPNMSDLIKKIYEREFGEQIPKKYCR